MSWTDGLNYVLFSNPISSSVIGSLKGLATMPIFKAPNNQPVVAKLPPMLENLPVHRVVFSGNNFVRLAGLSGAAAVILGAYGAHSIEKKVDYDERKRIYATANNYHFINSLALLGVPLCRHPVIAGSFLSLGMLIFCGTCYYDAFTGEKVLTKLTPVGGMLLIFGWLTLML
ncbi:hypothetical protein RUM44_003832 [Polyplax serrata]|uniref:Transmembrane protein 256 homolog n=1 Tax=Polyplax serrata TaxID=468196 RepID=A0ABR1B147_POLSC